MPYNIYRIAKEQEAALISNLIKKKMEVVSDTKCGYYTATFFLCKEPDWIENIWWVNQYRNLIPEQRRSDIKNSSHFGVIIYSSDEHCFAIPVGKAHFYLREFGDQDFGIELACRIADEKSVKVVNSRSFGSKRTKAIETFGVDAILDLENGESLDYLQANTIDKNIWGKSGSFGTSAALTLTIQPMELDTVLSEIEAKLLQPALFEPPRAIAVKSKKLKAELDTYLSAAITGEDENADIVDIAAIQLSGIEFIFRDVYQFKLRSPSRSTSEDLEELDIETIRRFAEEKHINLKESWQDIKVIYIDSKGDTKYSEDLKKTISFITVKDDKYYFLKDGKWFEFSQNYIQNLVESVQDIDLVPHNSKYDLRRKDFEEWSKAQSQVNVVYPEYWYNTQILATPTNGFISYDRNLIRAEGYTVEPLDVYDPSTGTFHFVKRWNGKAADIAYLADQAINSIKILKSGNKIVLEGTPLECKHARLVVIRKGSQINSIVGIRSLIILQKLNAFKQECRRKNISCDIQIQYEI